MNNTSYSFLIFLLSFLGCSSPKWSDLETQNSGMHSFLKQMDGDREWRDSTLKEEINLLRMMGDTTLENRKRRLEQLKHPGAKH